ncbi:amidase [Kutzneria sp. NPDC051319]|uniref:amidase n=1 Tax=Kutzneria sp. NPDC051319 TaxID=3155047 RepID=UPI003436E31C
MTINPFTPAVELAAAIRSKEISPVEVADCYLGRMNGLDPRLNAFCFRADDEVRAAAAEAEEAVMRGGELPPFHGVPLPIKDLVDVAGWPTTHGSAGASRVPKVESDPVVRRFVEAGFLLLGKTVAAEFGTVPFTENETLGIARNPWDPERTPGGSSSGAGVAVAAGMAPLAHAADGGGSIRIPASCNGLVGLKPTRGLVTNGIVETGGLATSGVVTRTVADTAAVLDVLARHDPAAWWSPPTSARTSVAAKGLRIGVIDKAPIDGIAVDPACRVAVETTLRTLESLGHHVVEKPVPLPPFDELISAFTMLWNVGAAGIELADPDRVEPHNRLIRAAARTVDSWTYVEGLQRTQRLSRRVVEGFVADFDLVVTPTMACLPPPIGFWRDGVDENPALAIANSYPMAVFTALFNVTGQPAISLPIHHDPATGLPVGVQLVAAPWREDLLLQVSRELERAHPWLSRRAVA